MALPSCGMVRPEHRRLQMQLSEDTIHLWYAVPSQLVEPHERGRYLHLLAPDEVARLRRFRSEGNRCLFLVAHALVRLVLSRYLPVEPSEWKFAAGPHGKPEVAGPRSFPLLRFSLSHTRGLAAVALTLGQEVGVDVESINQKFDPCVARAVLAGVEIAALEDVPLDQRTALFLEYWTLK